MSMLMHILVYFNQEKKEEEELSLDFREREEFGSANPSVTNEKRTPKTTFLANKMSISPTTKAVEANFIATYLTTKSQ